jgi:hypothetical protein
VRAARDPNPNRQSPVSGALRRSGPLQTDLACSDWMPHRSSGVERSSSDRLDDQVDDQA